MKILFLSHFFTPHIGGVEKHIDEISSILKSRGHEITVLTYRFDNRLKYKECVNGIKIIRFGYPKKKMIGIFFIWFFILKNRFLIEQNDIVHIHDVFAWYLPFRFLYSSKKVYTTFHGYEGFPIRHTSKIIRKISEKFSFGSICIGDYLKKWYGQHPDVVSYGGVNLTKFRPRKMIKKYDGIFVGRLDEDTGIRNYISMIKILKNKGINFRMIVLGDGKYRSIVKRYSVSLGFVDNPEIYFANSRFSFVSGYLSILESFATKKLVFCTYDNDLKRDCLKLTPFANWIVIEKDPDKIAEKVQYLLKNKNEIKRKVGLAYEWVKGNSWEKLVYKYEELWGI